MALSNEELILLAHQTQADQNAKLILFFIIILYSLYALYIAKNIKVEHYGHMILKYFIFKIPAVIFLFHIPLMTLFLLSAVTFETVYIFIASFYSIYYVLFFLGLIMYGWKEIMAIFGFNIKTPRQFSRGGE